MADKIIYGLGEKLQQARKKRKLSQEQAAERIGVTRASIGRFERDELTPSGANLVNLAILYNVSLDYLVGIGNERYFSLEGLSDKQKEFILETIEGIKENFNTNK